MLLRLFRKRNKRDPIFVSYSHADTDIVEPLVRMLRGLGSNIFRDIEQVELARRWQPEIAKAIASSRTCLVFWSSSAADSAHVAKEYKSALAGGKDVIPVLLDSTPLSSELNPLQGLDFKRFFIHRPDAKPRQPISSTREASSKDASCRGIAESGEVQADNLLTRKKDEPVSNNESIACDKGMAKEISHDQGLFIDVFEPSHHLNKTLRVPHLQSNMDLTAALIILTEIGIRGGYLKLR